MKINKKQTLQVSALIFAFLSVAVAGVLLAKSNATVVEYTNKGVRLESGVQVISIKAGLGYAPNRIQAQANIPTRLDIETNNTYDCTAYLNIPKLNVKEFLPPTGVTQVQIESQASGEEIEGYCGSDTYKFIIKFS